MDLETLSLNHSMRVWMVGLPVAYLSIALLLRLGRYFPHRLEKGTLASDYIAFDVVAGGTLSFLSVVGFIAWFNLMGEDHDWSHLVVATDRFYGSADFITNHLIIPMLSYQLWNTVICIVLSDLRSPVMILHHVVTASLAYGCTYPYGSYYTIFFFGVSEATNIPLTFLDVMEKLKLEKMYAGMHKFFQISFFLSFIVIRILLWTVTVYYYLTESWQLLQDGSAHSAFHVVTNFFSSFFLTALQYYWAWSMIMMIIKGDAKSNSSSNQKNK